MVKVADDLYVIYDTIRPKLLHTAYRFKVPNPELFVDEWLYNAYVIADKFDNGRLVKKVFQEGEEDLEDFSADNHSDDDFRKSFRAYLRKSFYHDVVHNFKKNSRFADGDASEHISNVVSSKASPTDAIDSFIDLEPAMLDDILALAKLDAQRLTGSNMSLFDIINKIFIDSVVSYCQELRDEFGNIVVAPDISCEDNKKFFSDDFRGGLESGVRVALSKAILNEDRLVVIWRLGYLIDPNKKAALAKRLFRYLFRYHKGYPVRLRKRLGES